MAGSRKEYELLFKLQAALGSNFSSTFNNAVKTTKQLQNTLQNLNSVQKKVDGYKKQEQAISTNKDKLSALQDEHKKLQQQMSATEKPSDSLKEKFERNARQIEQTTARIQEQEAQLGKLGNELRSAGVNTENLEKSNQKLAKSYEAVQRSQQEIAKISAAQQKNAQAISETRRELGKTLGVIGAVGTAIYAGPVRTAAEFEAQMSKVEAISGATAEQMDLIIAEAKRMGRTTKFTAVESGEALEYMAMAGWKTEQMLGGLEGIMLLAAASGEDLGAVSDIVTDALTAFSMDAEDAAHFADVLAAAAANSNTNVGMLGESFKYAAPLAGAFGFSVEDTAILLGLMANSGIKASQGGTQLRKLFSALSSDLEILQADGSTFIVETAKMDGSMRDLKDIIDDVRLAFNGMSQAEIEAAETALTDTARGLAIELSNENGELKTQAELYEDVMEAVEGLTAAGKVQEAEAISGKVGMAGLLAIVNASEEDYNSLAEAIYNADGAAQRMSDTMMDNYQGSVVLAKSALEGLQIAIGDALLPTFTELMTKLTNVISRVAEFAEANPELTRTILKVAGALAGLKVAGLAGKLAFLELKGGVLGIQKVLALFKGNVAKTGAEAVTHSGKLFSLGKGIKGYFSNLNGAMGNFNFVQTLMSKFNAGSFGQLITKGLGNVGSLIAGPFQAAGGKIAGIFGNLGQVIASGPLGKLGGVMSGVAGKIGTAFAPVGNLIKTALGPLGKLLGSFGPVLGKVLPVVGVISLIIAGIKLLIDNLDKVREFVGRVFGDAGLAVFDKVVSTITNIANTIKGIFSEGNLGQARDVIRNIFGESGVQAFDGLVTVIQTVWGVLQSFMGFIDTYVKPIVAELFSFIVNTVLPMIAEKFAEWAPTIAAIIEGLWTVISAVAEKVMQVVSFLMPTIKSVIGTALEGIMGLIGGLLKVIRGVIDFVVGVFTGDWKKAWEGVKNIFGGVWDSLKALVKAPLNFIIDGINLLLRGLSKIKIPDWVPGLGGKGFDFPEIPKFAKGTDRTPDTFIAGENGAELITNAKNRTVFTAAQTKKIMQGIGAAQQAQQGQEYVIVLAPALQALLSSIQSSVPVGVSVPQAPTTSPGTAPTVTAPTVSPAAVGYDRKVENKFEIHNEPTLIVENGDPEALKATLEENNEKLLRQVEQKQKQAEEDQKRGDYD